MVSWANGRVRVGPTPAAPPLTTDGVQMRVRASGVPAPTTAPIPIVPPTSGRFPINVYAGALSLLIWVEPPTGSASLFLDYSTRWRKHPPKLNDTSSPSGLIGVDPLGAGVFLNQSPVSGGTGTLLPCLSIDGISDAPLIDILASPIYSVIVEWTLDGPLNESDGMPVALSSSSPTIPPVPAMQIQPIIGDSADDGPWLLYAEWHAEWIGAPGEWSLIPTASLTLSHGTGPRVTTSKEMRGRPGDPIGETSIVEIDNTNNRLRLRGGGTLPTVAQPGGWPAAHILGASETGDVFSDLRQLNGNIVHLAILGMSLEESVLLLSTRSVVPGTGDPFANISFRVKESSGAGFPHLAEYAHYWPLDDASSPMIDLVEGSRLNVINPSLATFRADGIVNPLAPTHTKGLHLARASDSATATAAYLQWDATAPNPSIGTGALGHDLTLSCFIRWEGPSIGIETVTDRMEIFEGTDVPFGASSEPSLNVQIPFVAEPFGIHFETVDSVVPEFEVLSTSDSGLGTSLFDWPAFVSVDGFLVPHKNPTWALLAVVLRSTAVQMQMEIWMDGTLIATKAGSNNGWGTDATLQYVARSFAPCTIQHLTIWPFALTAAELAGL